MHTSKRAQNKQMNAREQNRELISIYTSQQQSDVYVPLLCEPEDGVRFMHDSPSRLLVTIASFTSNMAGQEKTSGSTDLK